MFFSRFITLALALLFAALQPNAHAMQRWPEIDKPYDVTGLVVSYFPSPDGRDYISIGSTVRGLVSMGSMITALKLMDRCKGPGCRIGTFSLGVAISFLTWCGTSYAKPTEEPVNFGVNASADSLNRFMSQLTASDRALLATVGEDQQSGYTMAEIVEHMNPANRETMDRIAKIARDSGIQISLQ